MTINHKPGTLFKLRPDFQLVPTASLTYPSYVFETLPLYQFVNFSQSKIVTRITKQDILTYLGEEELFRADDLFVKEDMFLVIGKHTGFFKLDYIGKYFDDVFMEIKEEKIKNV